MNVRRFRVLHAAGATYAEIARECGVDWRTVRKYLAEDAASVPPSAPPRAGTQPRVITAFVGVIEAWLRADVTLKGSVIHERLVDPAWVHRLLSAGEDVPGRSPAADRCRARGV